MVQLSRRTMLLASAAWTITELGPSYVRAQSGARPSLPIPPELKADSAGMIRLDVGAG